MTKPPVTVQGQVATTALVARSQVVAGQKYADYKEDLRRDFFHQCAYCTTTEGEAAGVRFTIDHYEPQVARPDLVDDYTNLMWACDICNMRKGDLAPPEKARADGYRFFRVDEDLYDDHFELRDRLLNEKSMIGEFTIEMIDLNRHALQRVRDFRKRLGDCEALVAKGVLGLQNFSLDQIPRDVRGRALAAIRMVQGYREQVGAQIDQLLREYAKSHLIDNDPEQQKRLEDRAQSLKDYGVIYPGTWRAPRGSKAKR